MSDSMDNSYIIDQLQKLYVSSDFSTLVAVFEERCCILNEATQHRFGIAFKQMLEYCDASSHEVKLTEASKLVEECTSKWEQLAPTEHGLLYGDNLVKCEKLIMLYSCIACMKETFEIYKKLLINFIDLINNKVKPLCTKICNFSLRNNITTPDNLNILYNSVSELEQLLIPVCERSLLGCNCRVESIKHYHNEINERIIEL
jgi:hypothetical protein